MGFLGVLLISGRTAPSRNREGIEGKGEGDERSELAAVVARIAEMMGRLEKASQQNGAFATLRWYLGALHKHAVATIELDLDRQQSEHRAYSVDSIPDSAIELGDDQRISRPRRKSQSYHIVPVGDMDELLDELSEMPMILNRPPTPPPRSRARPISVHRRLSISDSSHGGSVSDSSANGHSSRTQPAAEKLGHQRDWSAALSLSNMSVQSCGSVQSAAVDSSRGSGSVSDYSTYGSSRAQPRSNSHQRNWSHPASLYNASVQSYGTGELPPGLGPEHPPPSPEETPSNPLHSVWSEESRPPSTHRPSLSTSTSSTNPYTAPTKRSSSRLASAFKGFHFRRNSKSQLLPPDLPLTPTTPTQTPIPAPTVFGTPLAISIPIARGVAGTHHTPGGSSSQTYPLCILRCVYHLRDSGLLAPDIFDHHHHHYQTVAPPTDNGHNPPLVIQLKEIFSSAETSYGRDFAWGDSPFTVYDAADLILLFLSELPTPLVPEGVAKRWIKLSRQATIPGSLAMRLDQGMDFWEEAFMGLKGREKALFKLLLGLWGEVADGEEVNDMTAERLAGRVMGPLMHKGVGEGRGSGDTDVLLGLAFMIRKRAEYNVTLRGGGRSNAAF